MDFVTDGFNRRKRRKRKSAVTAAVRTVSGVLLLTVDRDKNKSIAEVLPDELNYITACSLKAAFF